MFWAMMTPKNENVRNSTHILNGEDIQENKPDAIRKIAKVRISRQRREKKSPKVSDCGTVRISRGPSRTYKNRPSQTG
jgi:hypothetical protein